MDENLCFFFCDHGGLKDYLQMLNVLERTDVASGFVHFSNASRSCTLGILMKPDSDEFANNLLNYPTIPSTYQQSESLDQNLDIVNALKLALLDFNVGDFCQTKNLADVCACIARSMGVDIDPSFPCTMSRTPPSTPPPAKLGDDFDI